ncbi:uncharacterized protein LOC110660562 isoform X2 [Hevea brasiliensis]|uniref:uncharacterized protein LOC110660562 isoform X2 n=1 Tax=Hevea brasiliensis TaxID=3981 RepID=UPI0025D6F736|nr:uncharacterized protein LOC110660562 isoform X2 [Hevea brasiliensis]
MNQQDPLLSSSSRREIPLSTRSIGCMSGIFQLVCKYHNRRRFLTSKKEPQKNVFFSPAMSSSSQPSCSSPPQEDTIHHLVPRSPTLPAEMRASQPALVARLMGLNDIPAAAIAAEKRRRLLGALEKCDEDLKTLKKMIEVVKSVGDRGDKIQVYYRTGDKLKTASPVSVVDEFTRSAFCGYSKRHNTNIGKAPQQRKRKVGDEDITSISLVDRIKSEIMIPSERSENLASPIWSSTAMVESVNEACKDIEWGQRREIGRIGLALQDYIFRDLIEEIVREMGFCCICPPLPLESCKRRLRFY